MGTYYIPRNVKGETRLLYIFSIKSLITTAIGAFIGFIFYLIFMRHSWNYFCCSICFNWVCYRSSKNSNCCRYSNNKKNWRRIFRPNYFKLF